jgi:preprotein translocase subunit SecF
MRIFTNPNYNFITWRWHALVLSAAIILGGVATIVARGGLPLGIDFSGGTAVVLEFAEPVTIDAVRQSLGPLGDQAVVQQIGAEAEQQVMVRLPLAPGPEQQDLMAGESRVEGAVRAADLGEFTVISRDIVGPVVGSDLRRKGIAATLTALGGILIYLGFRFRFTFAVGAIVATFHDILVVLVFLTWFGYDVSLNVIAGILAIAGYSVNDTIVVFDRVRENQRFNRREPLEALVNKSVNQTLSRTVITAGTTFLAVMALFLFGGEVLRGFAFTMLVGVIVGAYSTVFIAAALAIILTRPTVPAQAASAPVRAPAARRKVRG